MENPCNFKQLSSPNHALPDPATARQTLAGSVLAEAYLAAIPPGNGNGPESCGVQAWGLGEAQETPESL